MLIFFSIFFLTHFYLFSRHSQLGFLCCLLVFLGRLYCKGMGAQWLSGRVLDSRPRGPGFEPHRHHCVVVLEKDTFILA